MTIELKNAAPQYREHKKFIEINRSYVHLNHAEMNKFASDLYFMSIMWSKHSNGSRRGPGGPGPP